MATNGLLSGGAPLFGGTASDIGILGYTPTTPSDTVARGGVNVPIEQAMFEGSNKYENYVRAWPDLLQHYLQNIPTDTRSMADWGRHHWETTGQYETDAVMAAKGKTPIEAFRARGMLGDTPVPRSSLGPDTFPASRFLPAMAEAYDPRVGITGTTSASSAGVPMPDVEGYKYAYRPYEWSQEAGGYEELSYDEYDIDKYPYYPYLPTGSDRAAGADRILAGVKLVPDTGQTGITSSTSGATYGQADYTPNYATDSSNNGGRQYITNFPSTGNTYEDYVTRYPDLDAAYTNYLNTQDSGVVDLWEEPGVRLGVGGMGGWAGGPMSKAQFGHAHWLNNGQTEGRIF